MGFGLGSLGSLGKTLSNIGESIGWMTPIVSDVLQNQANKDAQERQQAFDTRMWNLQNEYNTPANQVVRLRQAGLNPNLFYSQGNPGNATSHPTTQAVRYQYDFGRAIDKKALLASVENMRAQNENLHAQNEQIKTNTAAVNLANTYIRKYGMPPNLITGVLEAYEKSGRDPQQALNSVLNLIEAIGSRAGGGVGSVVGFLDTNFTLGHPLPTNSMTKSGEFLDDLGRTRRQVKGGR